MLNIKPERRDHFKSRRRQKILQHILKLYCVRMWFGLISGTMLGISEGFTKF